MRHADEELFAELALNHARNADAFILGPMEIVWVHLNGGLIIMACMRWISACYMPHWQWGWSGRGHLTTLFVGPFQITVGQHRDASSEGSE